MSRRQSRIISIVLVVLCVAVPALSAEQSEQVIKMVPADVLFCARVKNLEYTANMIDQFLVGISPVPLEPRCWCGRSLRGYSYRRPCGREYGRQLRRLRNG